MQREVNNVIFSDHALQRLRRRRISQDMVVHAIQSPDRRQPESDGDMKFIKEINSRKLHVVSHYLDDEKKWLVVSAWVRGEDDPKPLWQRLLAFALRLFGKARR